MIRVRPDAWIPVALRDVAAHSLGKMLDRAKHTQGIKLPYLRNINVQWQRIDTDHVFEMFFREDQLDRFALRRGDLLICEGGEPGRCAIWDGRVAHMKYQKALHRVRPSEALDSKFLLHSLRHDASSETLAGYFTGTTIKHFTGRALAGYEIWLPPLNEQRRIVSKLDACFVHTKKAKEALDKIPPLLEKFRQSVLAAAFRGDLTKDWRKENPNVEPAEKLLARIRVERRQKWEEDYLKKQQAKGKEPKNDKWKTKYKEPEPVDTEGLPELPKGWCWARLAEMCPVDAPIVYGIVQPGPNIRGGVPYVRPADIRGSTVEIETLRRTSPEIAKKHARAALKEGDLVFSIVGTIGKWLIVGEELIGANITQSAVRIRPLPPFSAFGMLRALQSQPVQGQIKRLKFGNAVQRLNVAHMRELALPIPPVSEARELNRRVEQSLSFLQRIGSNTITSLQETEVLTSSLLAKAFRGELVPQDPSDEPASALLERIRAEREAAEAKKPKKKRPRKKATKAHES